MTNRTLSLTEPLYNYLLKNSLSETEVMRALRKKNASLPGANMQIAPEQAQFMAFLVKLVNAKRAIEIGTYTGYSALAVAQALPDDGLLIACDIDERYPSIGKTYWEQANVNHKIDLRIAPALITLQKLIEQGQQNSFDFIFIDADKANYDHYYELALQLINAQGVIAIDNVLWSGDVCQDEKNMDKQTRAIHQLNRKIHADDRVIFSLVPIGDGLTLVKKK